MMAQLPRNRVISTDGLDLSDDENDVIPQPQPNVQANAQVAPPQQNSATLSQETALLIAEAHLSLKKRNETLELQNSQLTKLCEVKTTEYDEIVDELDTLRKDCEAEKQRCIALQKQLDVRKLEDAKMSVTLCTINKVFEFGKNTTIAAQPPKRAAQAGDKAGPEIKKPYKEGHIVQWTSDGPDARYAKWSLLTSVANIFGGEVTLMSHSRDNELIVVYLRSTKRLVSFIHKEAGLYESKLSLEHDSIVPVRLESLDCSTNFIAIKFNKLNTNACVFTVLTADGGTVIFHKTSEQTYTLGLHCRGMIQFSESTINLWSFNVNVMKASKLWSSEDHAFVSNGKERKFRIQQDHFSMSEDTLFYGYPAANNLLRIYSYNVKTTTSVTFKDNHVMRGRLFASACANKVAVQGIERIELFTVRFAVAQLEKLFSIEVAPANFNYRWLTVYHSGFYCMGTDQKSLWRVDEQGKNRFATDKEMSDYVVYEKSALVVFKDGSTAAANCEAVDDAQIQQANVVRQ